MYNAVISTLRTFNELLTAGIAITAFSLLLYALTFNLKDRVARSFALILLCVVIVFVGDAIASASQNPSDLEFWLRIQWPGIIFLPATYLHFSDAVLATTGRPSRGRRRIAIRLAYLVSFGFLLLTTLQLLVGPLIQNSQPAPHLQRTFLTWIFTGYYVVIMVWAWINLLRAYQHTVTSVSHRRLGYLLVGALAPALGSYPYLLFGSYLSAESPLVFWLTAIISNLMVLLLLVVMAYAVAFFGVPWPDRVVKRRLFKWLMRGPVTASTVLAITTLVRRAGQTLGFEYNTVIPILMVASILILEYTITLAAPIWERWLFHGGDRNDIDLLQRLEERLLTSGDLRQFLESILAAVGDLFQESTGFIAALGDPGLEMIVTIGNTDKLEKEDLSEYFLEQVSQNGMNSSLFAWGDYWLVPLFQQEAGLVELLGLMGISRKSGYAMEAEQSEMLSILAQRAALALADRRIQQQVFTSLEALTPEVELIQSLRAAARYGSSGSLAQVLTQPASAIEGDDLSHWVKDALNHYWGGPKLTESPLIKLRIVQQALDEHDGNPTNALRAILRQAIEHTRPEGERRFTGEWILYNILELKFLEGRRVREVAKRLAMSEADLYRKQRVAIEAVANAILDMEQQAIAEKTQA
jgi:N-terminal 7TM region of histidine kinase